MQKETDKFKIERDVLQEDTSCPKLFTILLECMFRNIELEGMGININGENLKHLRFTDDLLCSFQTAWKRLRYYY